MTDSTIERVAKAMYELSPMRYRRIVGAQVGAEDNLVTLPWEDVAEADRAKHRANARAALAALVTPEANAELDAAIERAWKSAYTLSANDADPDIIIAAWKAYEAAVSTKAVAPHLAEIERLKGELEAWKRDAAHTERTYIKHARRMNDDQAARQAALEAYGTIPLVEWLKLRDATLALGVTP